MKNKILKLNKAYRKIVEGINIIQETYRRNKEIKYNIYAIKKAHANLNKKILQLLKKEQMDKDWERLVIKLKKENNNGK